MKIGIFGGAFNPVHKGHINLADIYYRDLKLDRLIFVPTACPPHKTADNFAAGEDRLEMLRLALRNRKYEISDIEFHRKGKSYTYDTLVQLKELYQNDDFYLIIGADQFLAFDKWYKYKEIMRLAVICTAARENEGEKEEIRKFAAKLGMSRKDYFLSKAPVFRVSSGEIRKKIKNNEDLSCLLDEKVEKYICEKELYRV